MSPKNHTTIDARHALRLTQVIKKFVTHNTTVIQPRQFPPRVVPPGPRLLSRYSLGRLAVETARAALDANHNQQQFIQDEYLRRGMVESAHVMDHLHDIDQFTPSSTPSDLGHNTVFNHVMNTNPDNLQPGHFHQLEASLNNEYPDQGRYLTKNTMLSPYEKAEDLMAVGAPDDMINAYINSVGLSPESPSLAHQQQYDNMVQQPQPQLDVHTSLQVQHPDLQAEVAEVQL
mgnify:FL=1